MRRNGWFLAAGLVVCLVLAGVVSVFASGSPDGLEHAALQGCTVDENGEIVDGTCMAQGERDHDLADGVFADYGVRGLDNEALGTGLAGLVGVLLTFALGAGLFWLVRRRGAPAADSGRGDGDAAPPA